jgi:hypothetical protein
MLRGSRCARGSFWALGRHPESDLALKTLHDKYADASSYDIALAHAYRGETGTAFQQLERAFRNRIFEMIYIRSEPLLANVRGDPRYSLPSRLLVIGGRDLIEDL